MNTGRVVMAAGLFLSLRAYRKERSIGYVLLAIYFFSPFVLWSFLSAFPPRPPPVSGAVTVKHYSRLAIPETLLVAGLAILTLRRKADSKTAAQTDRAVAPTAAQPPRGSSQR